MLYYIKAAVEIIIIAIFYYIVLIYIRGTRAENVVKGLLILVVCFVLFSMFKLYTLKWILFKLWPIAIISFVIIFYPELRAGLAKLGRGPFTSVPSHEERMVRTLVRTAASLSTQKIGGLIAIERRIGLGEYINNGVILDCETTREILLSIFNPTSPLHDGGVIISRNIIRSAASIFPLSERSSIMKTLGTRHRAAVGITEEGDAVVIVVSEENGSISVAEGGKLIRDLSEERLTEILQSIYMSPPTRLNLRFWRRAGNA